MQSQDTKWYKCDRCGKNLSSYHSLWRHKKKCLYRLAPYHTRNREIPTFDGSEFGTDKPKSKETMDQIQRLVLNQKCPKNITHSDDPLKNQVVQSVLGQKDLLKPPQFQGQNYRNLRCC